MSDESAEQSVRNAVLGRFLDDQAAGTVRPLADYQREFPGHEALVAEELGWATAATLRQIGHYEVRHELGSGGQATVYLAHDPRLRRDVALKVLPRGTVQTAQELRLQHEAMLAARLDDSGICPIYEVGRDGEHLFLAMKYVAGETLAKRLQRAREQGTPLPLAATLQFFEQLARTLHRAHTAGVVHRDIKPANVMVDERQAPVLLDFGLAAADGGQGSGLTRTGDVFGTPHYLPPERLDGRDSHGDALGDLWAFGVTLYEALTLQRPFEAPTLEQLYQAVLSADPPPLRVRRPDASRDLAALLSVCLEKDRRRRYGSALDLAEDLRAARLGEPVRARQPGLLRRVLRWHSRHAVAATAGWLVMAGLLSTITVQQRALHEVQKAQTETADLNEFLVKKMLLAVTPDQARGRKVTAEEVFDQAMQNVQATFAEPSRTAGTLQHVLGIANRSLGRNRISRDCLERAYTIRLAVLGPDARDTLSSQVELAMTDSLLDAVPAAQQRLDAALATLQRQFGADDPDTLSARVHQAKLVLQAGDYEPAERLARQAAEASTAKFGLRDRRTLVARQTFADALIALSRRREAEPVLRELLALRIELLGADAPAVADTRSALASLLHDMALYDGRPDHWAEAGELYEAAVAYARRVHGEQSSDLATTLNNHASFLHDRSRSNQSKELLQEAIAKFRESLALRESLDGLDSTRAATAAMNLGSALCDAGDFQGALPQLERAFRTNERVHGRLHPLVLRALYNLMLVKCHADGAAAAKPLIDDMTARLPQCTAIDKKLRLTYSHGLLQMHFKAGAFATALARGAALHAECLVEWPGDGGPIGQKIAEVLADAAMKLGDKAAEAHWRPLSQPGR